MLVAAANDSGKSLRLLLSAWASMDKVCDDGGSALHLAAGSGFDRCIGILIDAGVDMSLRNADGLTAEEMAKKNGWTTTEAYLRGVRVAREECVEIESGLRADADVGKKNKMI